MWTFMNYLKYFFIFAGKRQFGFGKEDVRLKSPHFHLVYTFNSEMIFRSPLQFMTVKRKLIKCQ